MNASYNPMIHLAPQLALPSLCKKPHLGTFNSISERPLQHSHCLWNNLWWALLRRILNLKWGKPRRHCMHHLNLGIKNKVCRRATSRTIRYPPLKLRISWKFNNLLKGCRSPTLLLLRTYLLSVIHLPRILLMSHRLLFSNPQSSRRTLCSPILS